MVRGYGRKPVICIGLFNGLLFLLNVSWGRNRHVLGRTIFSFRDRFSLCVLKLLFCNNSNIARLLGFLFLAVVATLLLLTLARVLVVPLLFSAPATALAFFMGLILLSGIRVFAFFSRCVFMALNLLSIAINLLIFIFAARVLI